MRGCNLLVRISAIFDLSLSSGMRATSWACLDSCRADHFGMSSKSSSVDAGDTVSPAYAGAYPPLSFSIPASISPSSW